MNYKDCCLRNEQERRPHMSLDAYLQGCLAPRLQAAGLSDDAMARVSCDVEQRLAAIISRWEAVDVRRTLLLPGIEEATFYGPSSVSLEIRALVVMGVRNSLIEDLASTDEAAQQFGVPGAVFSDAHIRELTADAVAFFSQVPPARLARVVAPPLPHADPFGKLGTDYPLAWTALTHLATGPARGPQRACSYAPLPATPRTLPADAVTALDGATDGVSPLVEHPMSTQYPVLVASGMQPELDAVLRHVLHEIATGVCGMYFSDSFKGITRRPEKLYFVIEFVLSHGASLVTHNYYLSPAYVARRDIALLRPAHVTNEIWRKFGNETGLTRRHREALRAVAAQLAGARLS